MPLCRLILFSPFAFMGVPIAMAEDRCSSLDLFVRTLTVVQDIEEPPVILVAVHQAGALRTGLAASLATEARTGQVSKAIHKALWTGAPDAGLLPAAPSVVPPTQSAKTLSPPLPAGFGPRIAELQARFGCLPAYSGAGRWTVDPTSESETTAAPRASEPTSRTGSEVGEVTGDARRDQPTVTGQRNRGLGFELMRDWRAGLVAGLSLASFVVLTFLSRRRKAKGGRRGERHTCQKELPFRIGRQKRNLLVVDVSRQGLKCRHDHLVRRRRGVKVQLGDIWLKGKIAWFNDAFAGIRLAHPLTDQQIDFLSRAPEDETDQG